MNIKESFKKPHIFFRRGHFWWVEQLQTNHFLRSALQCLRFLSFFLLIFKKKLNKKSVEPMDAPRINTLVLFTSPQ